MPHKMPSDTTRKSSVTAQSQRGFGPLEVLILLVIAALAVLSGWYLWQTKRGGETAGQPAGSVADGPDKAQSPWSEPVKSGKGGFEISFPNGWNKVIRAKSSDLFVVTGRDQPEFDTSKPAMVTDVSGYGSDSPTVFTAGIGDNFESPQGEATDFIVGKGDDLLSGKKYVFEYEEDSLEGIGIQRIKGDRTYTYVFQLGGPRELRVTYNVYAADPRNNIDRVDEIVRTVRVLR